MEGVDPGVGHRFDLPCLFAPSLKPLAPGSPTTSIARISDVSAPTARWGPVSLGCVVMLVRLALLQLRRLAPPPPPGQAPGQILTRHCQSPPSEPGNTGHKVPRLIHAAVMSRIPARDLPSVEREVAGEVPPTGEWRLQRRVAGRSESPASGAPSHQASAEHRQEPGQTPQARSGPWLLPRVRRGFVGRDEGQGCNGAGRSAGRRVRGSDRRSQV